MNFGKWIVVAFILFAAFIATLVTVCVRQDSPLVTKEYYQEELGYQQQIERERNTQALADKPAITVEANQLRVAYDRLPAIKEGQLKLFRPSDPGLDQSFSVGETSATSQTFVIEHPQPGLYRARFTWLQEGKEYYFEKILVL
jgi:hypothetical protein